MPQFSERGTPSQIPRLHPYLVSATSAAAVEMAIEGLWQDGSLGSSLRLVLMRIEIMPPLVLGLLDTDVGQAHPSAGQEQEQSRSRNRNRAGSRAEESRSFTEPFGLSCFSVEHRQLSRWSPWRSSKIIHTKSA